MLFNLKILRHYYRQDWAVQFYEDKDGITIAVENITNGEVLACLQRERFDELKINIISRKPTKYVRCMETPRDEAEVKPCQIEINPGAKFEIHQPVKILYSGSICGSRLQNDYGLAVGHGFPNDHGDVAVIDGERFGVCKAKFEVIGKPPITADISFIQPAGSCFLTRNILTVRRTNGIEGRQRYKLKLYKVIIRPGLDVMVVDKNGIGHDGIVQRAPFTDKSDEEHKFYRTLTIGCDGGSFSCVERGDCGGLVTTRPSLDSDQVDVLGFVIAMDLRSREAIVNGMWNVMKALDLDVVNRRKLSDVDGGHILEDVDFVPCTKL